MKNDIEKNTFGEDKKLGMIESKVNELSEKVEKLDVTGLKGQITGLSDKLEELKKIELLARRHIAFVDIESLRNFLHKWLGDILTARQINEVLYREMIDYIQRVSSASQKEVENSSLPISVAQNFRGKCQNYFDKRELNAFFES